MTIRVGINARTFAADQPGGAVQTSIKHAKMLDERPDTEIILFGHNSIKSLFGDNPTVVDSYIPHDSQIYGLFWERTALPMLAKKWNLDVLFCPNGNAPLTPVDCRVVMTIHDVNALKGMSSGFHRLYRKTMVPRAASLADRIVTVSNSSKKEILEEIDVCEKKIDVVYNGINEFYLQDGSGSQFDLPDKYLLFIGSMNPRKNVERIVRSFVRFKQRSATNHKLVLIGPENKAIFKSMAIKEHEDVLVFGFRSQAELKYAYSHADAFLFVSLHEGFGLPPLEAFACGTPVLASTIPPLMETLGELAIYVDPYDIPEISDGIEYVIENPPSGDELRKHARKYCWKRANEDLYRTFERALHT